MPSPAFAWQNGRLVAWKDAQVPIEDRGLQFGESVYEVLPVVAGSVRFLDAHIDRMRGGLTSLAIDLQAEGEPDWSALIQAVIAAESIDDGYVYIQVTGGTGERTHAGAPGGSRPNCIAYARPAKFSSLGQAMTGIAVISVPEIRWGRRDLKTTMLVPAVLAKREAARRGAKEAIFVDDKGFLVEGASSNVLAVIDDRVVMAPASERVLPGITQKLVADACTEIGVKVDYRHIHRDELPATRALALCSTLQLIQRIGQLDDQRWPAPSLPDTVEELFVALSGRLGLTVDRSPVEPSDA